MGTQGPSEYAVIGQPVSHSRSPEIHSAFAEQTGVALSYRRLESTPESFADDVAAFFARGGCGLNVTLPFKEDAAALATDLSSRAQAAGCANTLLRRADGSLYADNTDSAGLMQDLQINLGLELRGARILLLGAGGAARAAIAALADTDMAALHIANRSAERLQGLLRAWAVRLPKLAGIELAGSTGPGYDLILDATAAGLAGEAPAVPAAAVAANTVAYSLLYGEHTEPFFAHMEALGAGRVVDGWGMLVEQAAESFYLWHGLRPDTTGLIARRRETTGQRK